jgi:hypothetical protein
LSGGDDDALALACAKAARPRKSSCSIATHNIWRAFWLGSRPRCRARRLAP